MKKTLPQRRFDQRTLRILFYALSTVLMHRVFLYYASGYFPLAPEKSSRENPRQIIDIIVQSDRKHLIKNQEYQPFQRSNRWQSTLNINHVNLSRPIAGLEPKLEIKIITSWRQVRYVGWSKIDMFVIYSSQFYYWASRSEIKGIDHQAISREKWGCSYHPFLILRPF